MIESSEDQIPKGLSAPAKRALHGAEISRLRLLARMTEYEVLKLQGMRPRAIGTLREALKAAGQAFAQSK